MEQLDSHWADVYEILYLRIFRKSVDKIQVSLKSDKTRVMVTSDADQCTLMIISRSDLLRMTCFVQNSYRRSKHTSRVQKHCFENRAIYEKILEKCSSPGQATCACAVHTAYLWLLTYTQNVKYLLLLGCNNCCTNAPQSYFCILGFRYSASSIDYKIKVSNRCNQLYIFIICVTSHPTCFGPLLAHHQGCPGLLVYATIWFM
jgi:hypothetical protein